MACLPVLACYMAGHLLSAQEPPARGDIPQTSPELLRNPGFTEGMTDNGLPAKWQHYGGGGKGQRLTLVPEGEDGAMALLIEDDDASRPFGIMQTIRVDPGEPYVARVRVRAPEGRSPAAGTLLVKFVGGKGYGRIQFGRATVEHFEDFVVRCEAPVDATEALIYLYSRKQPNCGFLVDRASFRLATGDDDEDLPFAAGTIGRGPGLEAKTPPVYTKLKPLCLVTTLVQAGKAAASIVIPESGQYADAANAISATIRALTGATVPIIRDDDVAASVPITGNLICLGNRSTNRTVDELYNRHFTLLDLRYPGPGGHVVRTLHNPFGNGANVLFAGGSDDAGVAAAAAQLVSRLEEAGHARQAGAKAGLSLGWLADIRLPDDITISEDMKDAPLWSASEGYKYGGFFGWNVLSKRAALYYMTGDERHAREFLKLAFPDADTKREIRRVDAGKVDISDPLTGLDHYRSHRMILYWDLIEESPVFTDEERLRVTNAFASQLKHRQKEGCYRRKGAACKVGSRHGQWGAVCVYAVSRYFARDYGDRVWQEGLQHAAWEFESLHHYDWVHGENDNLFWYGTSMAPLVCYLTLSGDRIPLENGVLSKLMRAQEILLPGTPSHRHLRYIALDHFHRLAYLFNDSRWLRYRDQTQLLSAAADFRLGQSFWPDAELDRASPEKDDTYGMWTIDTMPEERWQALGNGLPWKQTFTFGGFRSEMGERGDYLLVDGYNGQGRNPYHCFAICEMRIAGDTILQGYHNQLIVRVDGLVEPTVPLGAALERTGVLNGVVFATAYVPNAPFSSWRRHLIQRIGEYMLVVDRLRFRAESDNAEIQTSWDTPPLAWNDGERRLEVSLAPPDSASDEPTRKWAICPSDSVTPRVRSGKVHGIADLSRFLAVADGAVDVSATLIAPLPTDEGSPAPVCRRLDGQRIVCSLPPADPDSPRRPALLIVDPSDLADAELVLVEPGRLLVLGLSELRGASPIFRSDKPVSFCWDFVHGRLDVRVLVATRVRLEVTGQVAVDGNPAAPGVLAMSGPGIALSPGVHTIRGALLPTAARDCLLASLQDAQIALDGEGADAAQKDDASTSPFATELPNLSVAYTADLEDRLADIAVIPGAHGDRLALATGTTVVLLGTDGKALQPLEFEGTVRVVHWWGEQRLLLVGCADEKVIAFRIAAGKGAPEQVWQFVSKMAPWVYTHQASHWWKEASPRLAGIHGLTSGAFLEDSASQVIVGSACTVEILSPTGRLLARKEQVWGNVVHSIIIPKDDGSRDLVSLRRPSLTSRVNILNSRTLDPRKAGYVGVPSGHTGVKSWGRCRYHLIHADLDGDGKGEVVGEINGPWDRVGVWDDNGRPLASAPFGPGSRASRSLRDLDVGDFDGDGKKEILVALHNGLIVVLDHQCARKRALRLPTPATVIKVLERHQTTLAVADQEGGLWLLDAEGRPTHAAQVDGRPDRLEQISLKGSPHLLVTTRTGKVAALRLPEELQ